VISLSNFFADIVKIFFTAAANLLVGLFVERHSHKKKKHPNVHKGESNKDSSYIG